MALTDCLHPKSLRSVCKIIAIIYLVLAAYQILWSVYHLTNVSYWIYYLNLIVNLVGLPFHAFLLVGANQERREYVYPWIIFTLVVIFPFCVLLAIIVIIEFQIISLIINLLALACRVYMWFRVREYHAELLGQTSSTAAAPPVV